MTERQRNIQFRDYSNKKTLCWSVILGIAPLGADTRTRTGDLRITNALLYQLSHIGLKAVAKVMYFFCCAKYSIDFLKQNVRF